MFNIQSSLLLHNIQNHPEEQKTRHTICTKIHIKTDFCAVCDLDTSMPGREVTSLRLCFVQSEGHCLWACSQAQQDGQKMSADSIIPICTVIFLLWSSLKGHAKTFVRTQCATHAALIGSETRTPFWFVELGETGHDVLQVPGNAK